MNTEPLFVTEPFNDEVTKLMRFAIACLIGCEECWDSDVMKERIAKAGMPPQSDEFLEQLSGFADEELQSGGRFVFSLVTVRLYSILEGAIDTMLGAVLRYRLTDLDLESKVLANAKVAIIEYLRAPEIEQEEILRRAVLEATKAKFRPGVDRFEAVLGAVGLTGNVHGDVKTCMREFASVRNLIVHRNGIVDTRFLEDCEWFRRELSVGDAIPIPIERYCAYTAAVHWYLSEIDRRWYSKFLGAVYGAEQSASKERAAEGERLKRVAEELRQVVADLERSREEHLKEVKTYLENSEQRRKAKHDPA